MLSSECGHDRGTREYCEKARVCACKARDTMNEENYHSEAPSDNMCAKGIIRRLVSKSD